MQRFILMLSCVIVFVLFMLQGFQPTYSLPATTQTPQEEVQQISLAPQKAIDDIYFNISTIGVEDATPERLYSDFGIEDYIYTELYGKYTDGRFGAADIIIMKPRHGMEQDVMEALQNIKISRMNLFKNYDIYNSYELVSNAVIVERGEYYILLMLEDAEGALEILEKHIPN